MKCEKCSEKSVFSGPCYCKKHFIEYFEEKVLSTIKNFGLISKNDNVAVAASGGKDSTVLLYLLKKFHGSVDAIAIDEGIHGYRSSTLEDLRRFCAKHGIGLKVYSFRDEFGRELDSMLDGLQAIPCAVCGTFRRYLMNKHARGYDSIATGHNMDDEVQSVLMNLLKNNAEMSARLGPKSGVIEDGLFVPRIKPLYFCAEKEVMAYSLLMGFELSFAECPHVPRSFRSQVRDALNDYEAGHPGTKKRILERFMAMLPAMKTHYEKKISAGAIPSQLRRCASCGEPAYGTVCRACQFLETLKPAVHRPNANTEKGTANRLLQVRL
jgi:uncharacterized protein (TIGR00269 family)